MICRNYTLIELVAATAILTAVLTVAAGTFGSWHREESPEFFAEKFRRSAAFARRRALATGKPVVVQFLSDDRRFDFEPVSLTMAPALTLKYNGEKVEKSQTVCRFFPDGSARAGLLEFAREQDIVRLRISPLTGFAELEHENAP